MRHAAAPSAPASAAPAGGRIDPLPPAPARGKEDPTGKVMEFNFDLGAISKSVKAAAAAHGWGFKTVIIKKNAMYR